jgi:mRNA-degrading endonuclease toxin of MazEF toxin-antitoxin module
MAAKARPCVILSISKADSQRNMSVIAPLTSQPRGGECEVPFTKPPWLFDVSVINLIGLGGVDNAKLGRFIGRMKPETMEAVSKSLVRMLGL